MNETLCSFFWTGAQQTLLLFFVCSSSLFFYHLIELHINKKLELIWPEIEFDIISKVTSWSQEMENLRKDENFTNRMVMCTPASQEMEILRLLLGNSIFRNPRCTHHSCVIPWFYPSLLNEYMKSYSRLQTSISLHKHMAYNKLLVL